MNLEFLQSMGVLLPPKNSDFTITTNLYGDVVMLSEDGNIYFGNIHSNSSERNQMTVLEVDDVGHVHDSSKAITKRSTEEIRSLIQHFTHIEFDSDGKVLLLWGKDDVAMIVIPDSLSRDGFLQLGGASEKCKFISLYSISEDASKDVIEEVSANKIVKACFHPFNSSAVVILRQSKWLKVINVSQYESYAIALDDKVKFSSFCFGPRMLDFTAFSLFLLSASGAVYYVSPIIPRGTAVSSTLVRELWSAVHEMRNYRNREVVAYSDAVESFLQSWLPLPTNSFSERQELIVAGASKAADWPFLRVASSYGGSTNSLQISASTHYIPLVQGPIAKIGSMKEAAVPTRCAVDICVSSSNAFTLATNRHLPEKEAEGAPVLFVSHSDGTIECLLLDNEEQELSLVFPSWKSMNRLKPDVTVPSGSQFVPRLVCVEVNKVDSKSAAPRNWTLTPDSVINHYIHVTSHESSQSYLLVCRWLERALQAASAQHCAQEEEDNEEPLGASQRVNYAAQESKDSYFTRGNSGIALRGAPARAFDNEDEDDDDDDDENDFLRRPFNSRQPLYEHKNSENTETAGASKMDFDISAYKSQLVPIVDFFEESSAAGHAQRTVISGVSILRDPFAGHIALFRTLSMSNPRAPVGEIWAVNLTVHSTLCDLYHQLAKKQVEGEEIRRPFKDVLQSCSEQAVRWRHSQQLIATIGEGLKKMPQVIHQAHSEQLQHLSDTTEQSEVDAINGRILDKAALQVHKDILLPMSELLNVTKFHFELAQETHAAQSEVLQGSSGGAPNHSDAYGIFQLLSKLKEDQSYLMERISRIKNRYAQQRENAEKFLTFAICQTNKLSRGEVLYKKQLEEWSAKVVRMGDQINAIQRMLPRRAAPGSVHSSPMPPPPSSPALSSSTSAIPAVSARHYAQPMSTPSPAPPSANRATEVGPSPILPSASPLMASWRSPLNASYEPSGRRADRSFATSSNIHGNSMNISFRIDHSVRAPMGSAAFSMTEDEQRACEELLTAQDNMIKQSKASVLALEERLRLANYKIKQRLRATGLGVGSPGIESTAANEDDGMEGFAKDSAWR